MYIFSAIECDEVVFFSADRVAVIVQAADTFRSLVLARRRAFVYVCIYVHIMDV